MVQTNEGVFHEAVNMASIWNLPVIFYCINNGYGISADIKKMTNIQHLMAHENVGNTIESKSRYEPINTQMN